MQKVFNLFSTVAFLGVVAIGAGAGYVYVQKDAIIDSVKEAALEEVTNAIPELVGGALGASLSGGIPSGGADLPGGAGGDLGLPAPVPGLGF